MDCNASTSDAMTEIGSEVDCDESDDEEFDAFVTQMVGEEAFDELADNDIEVLAAAWQTKKAANRQFKGKGRKGGGKGGKGRRGEDDRTSKERRDRIAALKAKSQCLDCKEWGHWKGDFACKKRPTGSAPPSKTQAPQTPMKPKTRSTYFVCRDDSDENEEKEIAVVEKFNMCEHIGTKKITRLGNAHSRGLRCDACDGPVVSTSRMNTIHRWAFLFVVSLRTWFGQGLRRTAFTS